MASAICLSLMLLLLHNGVISADGGIPAEILPDITNFQQDTEDFINRVQSFTFLESEPTVATCGDKTTTDSIWQNPKYPEIEGSLPSLCTLTLTPPQDTCALKVYFDDLALPFNYYTLPGGCEPNYPFFKMSHKEGYSQTLCNDLTNYEGIVEIDPETTKPNVLLLQLDPSITFKFRINVTTVPCNKMEIFQSPNICGIKNDAFSKSGRNVQSSNESDEESNEEEEEETRDNVGQKVKYRRARTNEFPWMAVIERQVPRANGDLVDVFNPCSAVILDDQRVLTAASCFSHIYIVGPLPVQNITIKLGDQDISTTEDALSYDSKVSKITIPFSYNPVLLKDDLAIITLNKPLNFQDKRFRPLCLQRDHTTYKDDEALLMGWNMDFHQNLKYISVKIKEDQKCETEVVNTIDETYLVENYDKTLNNFKNFICYEAQVMNYDRCMYGTGMPLIRREQTGAHFLEGLGLSYFQCTTDMRGVLTRVNGNSTFFNAALL